MAGFDATTGRFVTYDELSSPDLDSAFWTRARLPLPTGEHIPLDPNAALAVGEGEMRVTIPRFSLAHAQFQAADSPKSLVFSTQEFDVPPDRPAVFAVDMTVDNIGGAPRDYRLRMGALPVFELRGGPPGLPPRRPPPPRPAPHRSPGRAGRRPGEPLSTRRGIR